MNDMLKYLFVVVIIFALAQSVLGQVFLQGKVIDLKTSKPVPNVNVYLNNTTLGTTTNFSGEYVLNIPLGDSEVIFSFVGFDSNKAKISVSVGGPFKLDIKLVPSKQQLENVTIQASADKEWEKLIQRFEKIFFGETAFASQCKILNRWCIDLKMVRISKKRTLVATASQPLEVENLALGYKLSYDLQDFSATSESYRFSGYVYFREIQTTDSIQAATWANNRLQAYHGSSRHLFKSILDGRLTEEGFSLYTLKYPDQNTQRSLIFKDDLNAGIVMPYEPRGYELDSLTGKFMVTMDEKVEIHYLNAANDGKTYRDIAYPVASMEFSKRRIELNKEGIILNPAVMTTAGYLSKFRVPNLMPYDYRPEKKPDFIHIKPFSVEDIQLEALQEKVYLHTDKPYYYPGDVIWFKGYLKYQSTQLPDSMSKVLYVDLISPAHQVVDTKILQIDSGAAPGDLLLPNSLEPGTHYLRAYTNWMRNYNDADILIKPFPVLGFYENVESSDKPGDLQLTTGTQISITASNPVYAPRDSITMTLSLKDDFDNPLGADLSVSVTDIQSVVPHSQEESIVTYFMKQDSAAVLTKKEKSYRVEYGLSVGGQFLTNKGKPKKAKLTIIQGNLEDLVQTETDEQGRFWINGFHFFDSAELAFRAIDDHRRKLYGKVWLSNDRPGIPSALPVIDIPLRRREYKYLPVIPYNETDSVTILKEVVVESTKIEEKPRELASIGNADNVFDEEFFKSTNGQDIMTAIEGRVPGLQIIWNGTDYTVRLGGGFKSYSGGSADTAAVGMGGMFSRSSGEPLLIVNGVPDHSDLPFIEKIRMFPPSSIQRVEVFKYGSSAIYGANGANGVIAIYSVKGGEKGKGTEGYDKTLFQLENVKGFSVAKQFKAPAYSGEKRKSSPPDHRSTVFWNPALKTDVETGETSFSFYAADIRTKYRVIIEGVTSTGEPIHAVSYIEVK